MLLSPGNSPRHLSSPSPSVSERSIENPNRISSTAAATPTRNQQTVLDEDTYVASIEKIIERDFFPDIPKLRDRLDWLEAIRSGDPVQIRDVQLKIIERRRGKALNLGSTKGKSRTPGSTFFRTSTTPFEFDRATPSVANNENLGDNDTSSDDALIDPSYSLDQFFRRYTSEDNDSFSKIIEKVNRKRKERYGYLTEGENEDDVQSIEDAKRDRITDGYGTSDQPPSTLEGCKYIAKNLLMYHPADRGEAPLTEAERAERLKCLTKEINMSNTRFHGKMINDIPKEENPMSVLYTPVSGSTPGPFSLSDREGDKFKKYDLEDLKKTPNPYYLESSKKADNGYNFVRTPSPAPGADESPFITWGEIEGTPLRLDLEETPIDIGGSGDGPRFKIPFPPTRDLKAHSLSRDAARKVRDRSRMFQKPPLPSPVRGGSASPSARTLSPAAQKFVRNAIARSSHNVDKDLRASYRGGASPGLSTPKSVRSMSRLGREDESLSTRSPSVRDGLNTPW
ncbi:splicing factor ESS-2 homolog [Impatiens glandulifera]|uniref:splicing factor ESS-2 homolog n=1 Tax=Impatiens glandulifera TaxID=253017 RepID=UPI001FB1330F|nr:splicing factor ESS-2 homolog [Impatiens glandulifera]